MTRRFAEDTSVPVSRSQDEIKKRLKQAGADQIGVMESAAASAVAFTMQGRGYRMTVPAPKGATQAKADQEERRQWRLLLLVVKAKLEAIASGLTSVEREFLSDMIMQGGATVYENIRTQISVSAAPASLMLTHHDGRGPG